MWYDVPQEFDAIRGQSVIDHIRKVQPDILVNNRAGAKGDFDTPEQRSAVFRIPSLGDMYDYWNSMGMEAQR